MEYTIPHNFQPSNYMLDVLQDPHRFQVINWHRKARKTTLAVNQLIRWAANVKGTYWYIAPTYGNAKRVIWDDPYMFPQYIPDWNNPKSTFIKKSETELKVEFLHSGSLLYVIGADRFDLIRGGNPQGTVLDEYAIMKPEIWDEVIQPITRSNPTSWCWFLFTPKGKNHAFNIAQLGKRDNPEWKYWEMNVTQSGVYQQEQIEAARKDMTEAAFNQELMCQFLEGEGSVFKGVRGVTVAVPQPPEIGKAYVMGVDLGRLQDFTVVSVFDKATGYQVYQDRFQQIDWHYQKAKIRETARHYNNALTVMDATGLGDPIVDDLLRAGVQIKPFTITQQNKKTMIEKLSLDIEQKRITFIPIAETLFEYDNYAYEITNNGRVRYGAPNGLHDDIVMSHALAATELFVINRYDTRRADNPIRLALAERVKMMYGSNNLEDDLADWQIN